MSEMIPEPIRQLSGADLVSVFINVASRLVVFKLLKGQKEFEFKMAGAVIFGDNESINFPPNTRVGQVLVGRTDELSDPVPLKVVIQLSNRSLRISCMAIEISVTSTITSLN